MVAEPKPRPRIQELGNCPRWGEQLRMGMEPECFCGYADYDYTAPVVQKEERSILSSGTALILRYSGEFPALADKLCKTQRVRKPGPSASPEFGQYLSGRTIWEPECPFCGQTMWQTSLSGKRRDLAEERYMCSDGHRVSLVSDEQGNLTWE